LEPILPQLQELYLYHCRFDYLPSEICGQELYENVIREVRAHFADLRSGQSLDAELKIFILGNGGVGKTQLSRRLQDLDFDPEDFGGQDIYHGTHTLFLHGHAIFLLLWTPELERSASYEETGVLLRHRPLTDWLDYLRAFTGTNASVLIVQSQCDKRDKRLLHPPAPVDDFISHRCTEVSARTGLNLGILE
jgi:internalin A